jgi:hypothetical protein
VFESNNSKTTIKSLISAAALFLSFTAYKFIETTPNE